MVDITKRTVAITLIAAFFVAINPPVLLLVNGPGSVLGFPQLYLWITAWTVFFLFVLLWAAYEDVGKLSEENVPPELRSEADVAFTQAPGTSEGGAE